MPNVYSINRSTLTSIAEGVRELNGTTEALFPDQMKGGLDEANAEVSTQADLMAQIKEVLDRKAGNPPTFVEEKDVNFYDYDGTLLYSYTVAEAQALTELPPLPTQHGLICQEWNWSLPDLKALGRKMDVGATYITDDGATRLYLNIPLPGRLTVPLYFNQSVANGVTIDWGDGTATETVPGVGNVSTSHSYSSPGLYRISLSPTADCALFLGHGTPNEKVLGKDTPYAGYLYRVELGRNVTDIKNYSFHSYYIVAITIPNGVNSIGTQSFAYNKQIKAVIFPRTLINFSSASHIFYQATKMDVVSIPNGVTRFHNYFAHSTTMRKICTPDTVTDYGLYFATEGGFNYIGISKMTEVLGTNFSAMAQVTMWKIPPKVMTIGANCFAHNPTAKLYDFTEHTSVPALENANAFYGISADCEIRVPASLRDEWAASTNWVTYANQIAGGVIND